MSAAPEVSVIVPHYHDLGGLEVCLRCLARQTWPSARFEIVVADNASPEGEQAVAAVVRDRARLIVVSERGAGPARNGGVAAARGNILAFIDSDCRAEPEWLAEGVAALSGCDVVGGRVKVLVDDPRRMTPVEAFESVFAFTNDAYIARRGYTVTANLLCSRSLFEAVGGFRAGVSEDYDWCHRATDAGYRIGYADRAVVGHPARRTWPELVAKQLRIDAETYALFAPRRGSRRRWLLKTLALPASAIAHTPMFLFSNRLRSPGQRLAALTTLYRLRLWRFGNSLRLLLADRNLRASGSRQSRVPR